ncbi:preprotein translocase subunit SecA [Planctomycetota bacterium]
MKWGVYSLIIHRVMLERIGSRISKFLTNLFGSRNERVLRSLWPIVDQINALEPAMQKLSDTELRQKTQDFRDRLKQQETLDDILPEAFALTREASKRTTKMRHFDVQLIGGIVLHRGMITEMATGEGKTLVATLPSYLNALTNKGVHIVTVNDYLARRDRDWMGPIYELLGLTVGVIQNQMGNEERKQAYACDITYGTNNEFGFDYLRDNMKVRVEDQGQREHHYAIVDEVDSILIDEARTPLIISGPSEESTERYYQADRIVRRLQKDRDYAVKEKEHSVVLTDTGLENAHQAVGVKSFYDDTQLMDWPHYLEQALRAKELYRKDRDYIVKDGEVLIVDEFTGRLMPGRRWSDGLHQAVEAKEQLKIKEENQTLARVTLQNYFKMYQKLAGMTGTAVTEAMEFDNIYGLEVLVIPTNRPLIRHAPPDAIYRTENEKFEAIIEEILSINKTGRPLLVGTTSIETSERIDDKLKRRGITHHQVLNAKHHEREAQIVAKAGQRGTITIATNMAGRGTDIVLGEGVAQLGGLHILGTERHEARRIDNQLRGRAGRQGDPGSSQFFLSLEDTLMRLFVPAWVKEMFLKLGMKEGDRIQSRMLSTRVEKAQKMMEAHNFDIRKNLLEYDGVMNEQRTIIYGQRRGIVQAKAPKEAVLQMIKDTIYQKIDLYLPENVSSSEWNHKDLIDWLKRKFNLSATKDEIVGKQVQELEETIIEKVKRLYEERESRLSPEHFRKLERYLLLEKIDEKWKEHLYAMDYLKSGIGLRGYAQMDPKIVYKKEAYELFDKMLTSIKEEVTDLIFKIRFEEKDEERLKQLWRPTEFVHKEIGSFESAQSTGPAQAPTEKPKPVTVGEKVGRNDPCSCGSGKKYKKCCGKQ